MTLPSFIYFIYFIKPKIDFLWISVTLKNFMHHHFILGRKYGRDRRQKGYLINGSRHVLVCVCRFCCFVNVAVSVSVSLKIIIGEWHGTNGPELGIWQNGTFFLRLCKFSVSLRKTLERLRLRHLGIVSSNTRLYITTWSHSHSLRLRTESISTQKGVCDVFDEVMMFTLVWERPDNTRPCVFFL